MKTSRYFHPTGHAELDAKKREYLQWQNRRDNELARATCLRCRRTVRVETNGKLEIHEPTIHVGGEAFCLGSAV